MIAPAVILVTPHDLGDDAIVRCVERALGAVSPGEIGVQLRAPGRSARALLVLAEQLRFVSRAHGAPLYVNDRIDIARAVNADGVHLGRRSVGVADARLWAPGAFVSVAAHECADVETARLNDATAVLVSPIFDTPGKGAARGLVAISEARDHAQGTLVYALGGVDVARAGSCVAAGAHGVAVIRAVFDADDVGSAAAALVDVVRRDRR